MKPLTRKDRLKNIKALRPELQADLLKHISATGNIDLNVPKSQQKPVDFGLFAPEDTQQNLDLFS